MFRKSFYCIHFVILLVSFYSCESGEESKTAESKVQQKSEETTDDVNSLDTLRPDNITFPPFQDSAIVQILEGLKMCTTDSTKYDQLAPCDHNWFRVFKYMPAEPWEAGFLVEAKAGIYTSTRMVVCIYHQKNKFRIVNQYLGVVLEVISTKEGFSDLVMGYEDPEAGTVAILHKWVGDRYEPIEVLEINNRFVKDQYKDSINERFITNFYWGE